MTLAGGFELALQRRGERPIRVAQRLDWQPIDGGESIGGRLERAMEVGQRGDTVGFTKQMFDWITARQGRGQRWNQDLGVDQLLDERAGLVRIDLALVAQDQRAQFGRLDAVTAAAESHDPVENV